VLLLSEVYAAGEDPIPGATGEALAEAIRACGHKDVTFVGDRARLAQVARERVRKGDIVLTLGAGDVTGVGPELLALLGGG
jgi:UDP-N-acetylmuramate--alanine ligase